MPFFRPWSRLLYDLSIPIDFFQKTKQLKSIPFQWIDKIYANSSCSLLLFRWSVENCARTYSKWDRWHYIRNKTNESQRNYDCSIFFRSNRKINSFFYRLFSSFASSLEYFLERLVQCGAEMIRNFFLTFIGRNWRSKKFAFWIFFIKSAWHVYGLWTDGSDG